ncbi:MAG TPA: TonB-dependent receptor [Sphingobium sp.]
MRGAWFLLPAAFCAAGAHARDRPRVDLPAGRLGDAVALLGKQAGISITVSSAALWNQPVRRLKGEIDPAEAMRRLTPTGAVAVRLSPLAWRIEERRGAEPSPRTAAPPPPGDADAAPIIVTASKRDTRLDAFAGSVHLIDGRELRFGGERGTEAILSRIATLSSTHLGSGRNKLFIRGIADSSFTGPTQATVGQYLGDLRLTYNAPDPDLRLYDMRAVEILEGPQGTLYGAGSLGGVIRLIPGAPDLAHLSGAFSGGVSTTWHGRPGADAGGVLNLPLARDRVGLRLVGYGITEGGYIDDALRGRRDINRSEIVGGRATLRIAPGDGWTVDLGGILQDTHGRDNQYADPALPPLSRDSLTDGGFDARYRLGSVVVGKQWDRISFLSSTAYVTQRLGESYDASLPGGSPVLFHQENRTRLFATENRLSQQETNGFGWVVGASFIRNRSTLGRSLGPPDQPAPLTGVTNVVQEMTLYAEASLYLLTGLKLTGGARYSHSRLEGSGEDVLPMAMVADGGVTTEARSETRLLPSLALSVEVLPGTLLYTRYQQGFRPGGLAIEGPFVRRFRNDRIMTMESGLRHMPPGGRYSLTASFAYAQWRDIQADFLDDAGLPSTENIGDGRIWSASASARWEVLEGLSLDASFAFNDSRITQPSAALTQALALGRVQGFPIAAAATPVAPGSGIGRIPNVAAVTARAGFDYRTPIAGGRAELRVMGWGHYVSSSRLGIGPVLGERQGDYLDTALTARIGKQALGLTLGITNIADARGNRFALGTPYGAGSGRQVTPLRPRTIRIGIDTAF